MDHLRISGTKPSSVTLSHTKFQNFESDVPKVPKQAEAKREGVINPQNYNLLNVSSGVGTFVPIAETFTTWLI